MQERTIGKTELRASEVTLGTWGLASGSYGSVDRPTFVKTVETALEIGVTAFDMAPLWGDGQSEQIIGEVTRSERDRLVYVTRCGLRRTQGVLWHRVDRRGLIEDCEASLARLGTEYIDLALLHNVPESVWRRRDWVAGFDELKTAGKIRAWGATVGSTEEARMAISAGAQAVCIVYNLLRRDQYRDLESEFSVSGAGLLVRSPLAYGLLAGRWSAGTTFPNEDHRSRRWSPEGFAERVRQVEALRFLVHDEVPDLAAAALRFVLSSPLVSTALVGARTPEQIRHAVLAADGPPYLSPDDLAALPRILSAEGV